jgi:lysophospholipase L1-like esterase
MLGAKSFIFTNKTMFFIVAVTALFSTATALAEVRIVALGDSQIRGSGVPRNQTYPAQLEAALRARGHQVTVTNQGINGDTTQWLLGRLDSAVPPGTNIVVLQIGANDKIRYGASQDAVRANILTIKEHLRAKGVLVFSLGKNYTQGQLGILDRADLHAESSRPLNDPIHYGWHLNSAGYAFVVRRTLPEIEPLVRKVEQRR